MTPLDIVIKGYLREFFEKELNYSKSQMMPFGALPAIIIKEVDKEKFIDELWVHINCRTQESNDQESS